MLVDVDEPGGEDPPGGVEPANRRRRGHAVAENGDDPIVPDGDGALERGPPGPVDHPSTRHE
jgi:hypothetical protein